MTTPSQSNSYFQPNPKQQEPETGSERSESIELPKGISSTIEAQFVANVPPKSKISKYDWKILSGTIEICDENNAVKFFPFIKVRVGLTKPELEDLVTYIRNEWKLPEPWSSITVVGDLTDSDLGKIYVVKLQRAFQTTPALDRVQILTRERNAEVANIFVRAVKPYVDKVVAFSVLPWSSIALKACHFNEDGSKNWIQCKKPSEGKILDSNHYIFVDDAISDDVDQEKGLREECEKGTLSDNRCDQMNTSCKKFGIDEISITGSPLIDNVNTTINSVIDALTARTFCVKIDGSRILCYGDIDVDLVHRYDTIPIWVGKEIVQSQLGLLFEALLNDQMERVRLLWESFESSSLLSPHGIGIFLLLIEMRVKFDGWISNLQHGKLRHFLEISERKYWGVLKKCLDDSPEKAFFVFSLLFVRLEMSDFFWVKMKSKTAGALFAIYIAREMLQSLSTITDVNLLESVQKMKEHYEQRAIGGLNACYSDTGDSKKCSKLLETKHQEWFNRSCLTLAEGGHFKAFIAQNGCQNLARKKWRSTISNRNSLWMIALAVIIPQLVLFIWFDVKVETTKQQGITKYRGETKRIIDDRTHARLFYRKFYEAAMVKYTLNIISNVILLILFTHVVLIGLQEKPTAAEWILIFWMVTLASEEGRQFQESGESGFKEKCKVYFGNKWNIADASAVLFLGCGFILRFFPSPDLVKVAHVFYVLSLVDFFIRFTSVFSMSNRLGPKIAMISKMTKDLADFMCIASVYMIAYGVAVQALAYVNVINPLFSMLWGILFRPLFEMLGEPNLEEIGAENLETCLESSEATWSQQGCTERNKALLIFVVFMKALYMLFTNVLLLNLLIAMFNNRYKTVNLQANEYWKFYRLRVILEFYSRPLLPPPFIIISHVHLLANVLWEKWSSKETSEKDEKENIEKWEEQRVQEYLKTNPEYNQKRAQQGCKIMKNTEEIPTEAKCSNDENGNTCESALERQLDKLFQTMAQMDKRMQRTEDMMRTFLQSNENSDEKY